MVRMRAVGMYSSLGTVVPAAAAYRCGLKLPHELSQWPYFGEETKDENFLVGYPAACMPDGFQEMGRFLKLGSAALRDLMDCSGFELTQHSRIGLHLVLPSTGSSPWIAKLERTPGIFFDKLCRISGIETGCITGDVRFHYEGRLGLASAFEQASGQLTAGRLDFAIVGAIDSLLDGQRLYDLVTANKVKTVDRPLGLTPGEAACFVLLQNKQHTGGDHGGVDVLLYPPGRVQPPQVGKPDLVPNGQTLSDVIDQALKDAQTDPEERGAIYTDLNGSEFRAKDFANALVRLSNRYRLTDWKLETPAESFGDTGAASGLLAICLSVRAFARNYHVGNKALVVLSSEQRGHGALVIGRSH